MKTPSLFFSVLFVSLWFGSYGQTAEPTYWQDIRPILRKHCTACHNTKNLKEVDVSGGLALDSFEAILENTKKPVVRVGQSKESMLIKAVTTSDEEKRMPLSAPAL